MWTGCWGRERPRSADRTGPEKGQARTENGQDPRRESDDAEDDASRDHQGPELHIAARDLQAEVSPAPLVTPADAVGFGEEFTRISQEFYVGSKDAQATAQEILTVLGGMQPSQ